MPKSILVDLPAVRQSAELNSAPVPLLERLEAYLNRSAGFVLLMPAVLLIASLAIFPLFISLYISLARLKFIKGGFELKFVGLANYAKLLVGLDREHFVGRLASPGWIGWSSYALLVCLLGWLFLNYWQRGAVQASGVVWRLLGCGISLLIGWYTVHTLAPNGRPGTLIVTMIFVFGGVAAQFLAGLGLAILCAQHFSGRRFFRVVFLLPMMITPVGIGYMFRMLADTSKGPLKPLWVMLGLENTSWVQSAWGARAAVMVGDFWQWTPFMFIVLLAALESQSVEEVEAAVVDGATFWQIFRHITIPAILPVSSTVVLIRMIEAFKIIDLPNILTNGGPGTATESVTLHAYSLWRRLDIGGSAAVGYLLLVLVTFFAVSYANFIRPRHTVE